MTAADRYAYGISVPNMYNIVGREWVEALHSECWEETWEARRQQQATRATQEKRNKQKIGRKRSGNLILLGGTPFHGVRAIEKKHDVARARLKCYVDSNAKRNHGYDTDSSALV